MTHLKWAFSHRIFLKKLFWEPVTFSSHGTSFGTQVILKWRKLTEINGNYRNKFALINDHSDIGLGISRKTGSDETKILRVPDIETRQYNSKIDNEN